MNTQSEMIPLSVDISRIIELLADQIYPSPFTLLRENVQNSYDAVLLRLQLGQAFKPKIEVTIEPDRIIVNDNGIGMLREELEDHFWKAGSSSKNTDFARTAGVVGTFGIGAMANFGIAEELIVVSESAKASKKTKSWTARSKLSATSGCITFDDCSPTGYPGTVITAIMQEGKSINVIEAEKYISQFVAYLSIDVFVNGKLISRKPIESTVPDIEQQTWSFASEAFALGEGINADVNIAGAFSGETRIIMQNIVYGSQKLKGRMILRQGIRALHTYRNSFGLAVVSASSAYGFGGIADFDFLQPTAGREALTSSSMQLLQRIITRIDECVSLQLSNRPESNVNTYFVNWVAQRCKYELCSYLRVRLEPDDSLTLREVKEFSQTSPYLAYSGMDNKILQHASADRPIIMLSRESQRRNCEINYLRKYCKIEEVSNNPTVISMKSESEMTLEEKAFAFRIASVLSKDYFLEVNVRIGEISHGIPVLVTKDKEPIELVIDTTAATAKQILDLFDREYMAFGHMVIDFVRNIVFPMVSNLVPSATRQGAEAFLKTFNRPREVFEYELSDSDFLTAVWQDYLSGKLSFQQAANQEESIARRSYIVVDNTMSGAVKDIIPDVVENENVTVQQNEQHHAPLPPIQRLNISTDKKILLIGDDEPALKGYRCFLAMTDRIREERGEFFLQPHRTSIVWGGQKLLFVFEHHSGEFGIYYDLQAPSFISDKSGGATYETCTIVMKNRIFIPIPTPIQESFIPQHGKKKRIYVRYDILYIERGI